MASISDLLNQDGNLFGVLADGEHKVVIDRGLLVGRELGGVEVTNLVDLAEFANSTKEVIS